MQALGHALGRYGARSWRLARDLAESQTLIESFVVDSWADYLRRHRRAAVADLALQDRVFGWQVGKSPPTVRQLRTLSR